MELITIKLHHEELIQLHNLSLDELPNEIVASINEFNELKTKLYGNTKDAELIEELKRNSLLISYDIRNYLDNRIIVPEEELAEENKLPLVWLIEQMDKSEWGYLPRWKKDDIIEQAKEMELRQNEEQNKVIATQNELIYLLETQIVDLVLMSKIELGEDVIQKIVTLKKQLKS